MNNWDEVPSIILAALANSPLPPLLLALVLVLPSAILYSLQVALILRHRHSHFASSFFKLFAAKAIANLIGLVGAFLCQRFGMLGGPFLSLYLQLPRLCLASFYFLVIHFSHIEVVAITIIVFNRLTAIAFPFSYEKFWKRALPWAIAIMYLLPLPVTWQIFTLDEYVHQGQSNKFTLDNHKRPGDLDDVEIGAWSTGIFTFISLCLNLGCLATYKYVCMKHRQQRVEEEDAQQSEVREAEMKMTVYTVLTFLGQLFCTLYLILLIQYNRLGLDPSTAEAFFLAFYNQLPWVNDLNTIVLPAWLLLWASRSMRERLDSSFFPFFFKQPISTNPNSSGPRAAWN